MSREQVGAFVMDELLKYARTIRFLRPAQVLGQGRRLLGGIFPRIPVFRSPRSGLDGIFASPGGLLSPGSRPSPDHRPAEGVFEFLHQKRTLGLPPDWNPSGVPLLWTYNLHYFEWLWDLDWEPAKAAAENWIVSYLPGKDRPGWDPYPLTLRLQNWALFFFGRHRVALAGDPAFRRRLEISFLGQGARLRRSTEYHLLGNHYFDNGAVLALLGSVFKGSEPAKWLRRGLAILRRQVPEQILADGTHFELSPMYQCRIAYLLLLLARHGCPEVRSLAETVIPGLLASLDLLVHPDGGIALLNDSAMGIYPSPASLREAAGRIPGLQLPGPAPAGGWELPEAGYFGFRDGNACLICDAGPIGPDYIPGHGHGDIFSFELSLRSQRVVVDAGVCEYTPGPMREYARSTRAHNTVEIEGRDQCEFWGAFRVGRRGRPREVGREISPEKFSLWGWHDGYRRLPGAPIHHRRFRWLPPGVLEVEDRIESARPVRAVSRIHLHPACRIERREGLRIVASHPGGRFEIAFWGPGELSLESSYYSPEFGLRLDNTALAYSWFGDKIKTGFRIAELEWKAPHEHTLFLQLLSS